MDRILGVCVLVATICFSAAEPVQAADAAHGKKLFAAKCAICHNADKGGANKIGPNLYGVVGRASGSGSGFSYSNAMKGAGVVWTPDKLALYLGGPQKMLPGVRMTFPGFSNPKDAQDVIGYLENQSR